MNKLLFMLVTILESLHISERNAIWRNSSTILLKVMLVSQEFQLNVNHANKLGMLWLKLMLFYLKALSRRKEVITRNV